MTVSSIINPKRHFVIFACAYHEGFNSGYNVTKIMNFADFSWVDVGRVVSTSMKIVRTYQQFVIPVEIVLWKECLEPETLIEDLDDIPLVPSFTLNLVKALYSKVSLFAQKVKRKLAHFTKNDVEKVGMLGQSCPERSSRAVLFTSRNPSFTFNPALNAIQIKLRFASMMLQFRTSFVRFSITVEPSIANYLQMSCKRMFWYCKSL